MKVISKESIPYWLGAIIILFAMCFVLLYFSEAQVPTILTSSGIVAIISAVIGVSLTAFAISIQLKQQSDADTQKDKDVKIFEQKIRVYSEFTEKMWTMLDSEITDNELRDLRNICFRKLVFYLNETQINQIYEQINSIDETNNDTAMRAVGEITHILKNSLNKKEKEKEEENVKSGSLLSLFHAFTKEKEQQQNQEAIISTNAQQSKEDTTFWHFNMLDANIQLKAFKDGNWRLSLIEYGENWRSNLVKRVQKNDIVFLFRRGGYGYVGTFRAKETEVFSHEEWKKLCDKDKPYCDMYNAFEDGATSVANICVTPIAYNYNGVEYLTVRRRTIERINDMDAVKFLLNRFNGKDLDENRLAGKGKLDAETSVTLNDNDFSEIITKYLK